MPVIVVGADHPIGEAIAHKLAAPDREVRAFISSPETHSELRALGIKVAIGDLSDQSHVEAAAASCFTAVFVQPALSDGRELAFATPAATALGWARAAMDAKVKRVIWVGTDTPSIRNVELATVGLDDRQAERSADDVAEEVAYLDDLAQLPPSNHGQSG
jgi:nucleoside-diphosphate-sugar epimerase